MPLKTALVVSGGGLQGLALVKALRAAPPLRVLVADCHAQHVTGYLAQASFRAPPLAEPAAFELFLRRLCVDEQVHAVFPSTHFELQTLLRLKPVLEAAGTQVWISAAEVLALAHSKRAFYGWLLAQGLAVLPFFDSPLAPAAELPLIGKPDHGWGGRDLVRLRSPQQARLYAEVRNEPTGAEAAEAAAGAMRAAAPALVWQPLLQEFDELSVDFAVNASGQVSSLHLRRRLVTQGGFAVLCEPVTGQAEFAQAQVLALATAQRLADLGARGLLNLQVLQHQGQCWVSDFNARAGTSLPLSLATGFNPMAFMLDAAPGAGRVTSDLAAAPLSARRQHSFRMLQERWISRPALADVRGLVFDLDDTLFDQKDWIVRKLQLLWQQEQAWLPPQPDFLRAALQVLEEGERAQLLDRLCQRLDLPAGSAARLIDVYRSVLPQACHVYADVLPTLAQLRRGAYRLGLLTDNPAASQRQKLRVAGLGDCFDAVVLTGELGHPKPHAAAFDAVASALKLPPESLVMVGDNPFRDSAGALAADWAHAFHIQRQGAFFNFQMGRIEAAGAVGFAGAAAELAQQLFPRERVTVLHELGELNWYLQGAAP